MLAPLDTQEDDDLLARLRAGDEVAFRALVDRHRPWLVRLCTRLLGDDAHAAEDAAQESLLKLHAAARRDARPLRIRAWLTVVARNTCIDEQRRRRPDLPGVLPERAVMIDDPFSLDAALAEAWPRLAGRHREVLYLREVLGFSYKEIGSVMGLSIPAVETLVFRARAALRREYDRAGGVGVGCGLFGFHLFRAGFERRRNGVTQFLTTTLPGYGEQVVAKVLAVAAGVAVAAATVIPGVSPLTTPPPAGASVTAGAPVTAAAAPPAPPATQPVTLKDLLGSAVPADWSPQRSRRTTEAAPPAPAPPRQVAAIKSGTAGIPAAEVSRPTPLRDVVAAVRSSDRPTLRPDDDRPGPIRATAEEQPIRSILAEIPLPPPIPLPVPVPEPGAHPIRETVQEAKERVLPLGEALPAGDGIVADREPTLLQRRNG